VQKRQSIVNQRFSLAPRGFGNYSTLSTSADGQNGPGNGFKTPDNNGRLMKKTQNANFSTGGRKSNSGQKRSLNQSPFKSSQVFNDNARSRHENMMNTKPGLFNMRDSTVRALSGVSSSDIGGMTVTQLAQFNPRRAFEELAVKFKALKTENKDMNMMIRLKNLTIKDLE
jgi:hypothetical protein